MLKPELIQPNVLTSARYQYTITEKRLLYNVIALLQREMRGEIQIDMSLFGDYYFTFPLERADPEKKNHAAVRAAFQSLQEKRISIDYNNKGDGFEGRLINWGKLKDGVITISLNSEIGSSLIQIAKGFTAYSSVVVMALHSTYSMRFYEWCSRFRDTGKWITEPDELRQMLCIDQTNVYKQYGMLKVRVIDVAQKELKLLYDAKHSDICFTYEEVRSGRGRGGQVKKLIFTIYWDKKNRLTEETKSDDYLVIAHFLSQFYNANTADQKTFKETVLRRCLDENRLEMAAKLVMIAKTKNNPAAYFRTSMREQLGINTKVYKPTAAEKKNEVVDGLKKAARDDKMAKEGRKGEGNIGDLFTQMQDKK